jgi:hypothetical protein
MVGLPGVTTICEKSRSIMLFSLLSWEFANEKSAAFAIGCVPSIKVRPRAVGCVFARVEKYWLSDERTHLTFDAAASRN